MSTALDTFFSGRDFSNLNFPVFFHFSRPWFKADLGRSFADEEKASSKSTECSGGSQNQGKKRG